MPPGPIWNFASRNPEDHVILASLVDHELPVIENLSQDLAQNLQGRDVRGKVEALYDELQKNRRWIYTYEDQVHGPGEQPLRTPGTLFQRRRGTCIEYVILMASALLANDIHPLIIVSQRAGSSHAILGYWMEDNVQLPFPGVLVGDGFEEWLDGENRQELFGVIDASWIAPDKDRNLNAAQAEREALDWLTDNVRKYCHKPDGYGTPQQGAGIVAVVDVVSAMLFAESQRHRFGHTLPHPEHFVDRNEATQVKDWYNSWRDDTPGAGVLALIGPGGSGKSSIERELLDYSWSQEGCYRPSWSFVWRFGEGAGPKECLFELRSFLEGMQEPSSGYADDSLAIKDLLARLQERPGFRYGLVIFDEVESCQISDGTSRGCFKPEARELKELLQWCCESRGPMWILLSSKVELADLRAYEGNKGYKELEVGDLGSDTAIELLQAYNLPVDRNNLQDIIDYFGTNPLVLSLVAEAVRESGQGVLKGPLFQPPAGEGASHLGRIVSYYEQKMLRDKSLPVMRLLSLLSYIPVDKEVLGSICRRHNVSGRQLEAALDKLVRFDLVEVEEGMSSEGPIYTAHRSLRYAFRDAASFQDRAAWRRGIVRYLRRVSCRRLAESPTEEQAKRLLELIDQLVGLGRQRAANRVYRRRMCTRWAFIKKEGPYDLLTHLDLLWVGLRAIETILAADVTRARDRLLPWEEARLLNDKGGFERELGALKESEKSYHEALKRVEGKDARRWWLVPVVRGHLTLNKSFALRNPPRTLIQRGLLAKGYEAAKESLEYEEGVGDREGQQIALCLMAEARGLLGRIKEAAELYDEALRRARKYREHFYAKGYALRWALILVRAGREEEAKELIDDTLEVADRKRLAPGNFIRLTASLLVNDHLGRVHNSAAQTRRRELEILSLRKLAEQALEYGELDWCKEFLDEGLALCQSYGYALYWIDLQVIRGRLLLKRGHLDEAHTAARLALYGTPMNEDRKIDPDELSMIGAANESCGYGWGHYSALRLLLDIHEKDKKLAAPEGKEWEKFYGEAKKLKNSLSAINPGKGRTA